MKVGRPRKYTAERLTECMTKYFNSICYLEIVKDEKGVPLLDLDGNEAKRIAYISPPSVLGMCLFLEIDRDTLSEYQKLDGFTAPIKAAKAKCERYLADQLHRSTQVAGIIFTLKNNFGWQDVQVIEQTATNPLPIASTAAYSLEDLKRLEEIMSKAAITGEVVDI